VSVFADTSFVCALLHVQDNSPLAWDYTLENPGTVVLSTLVAFEFKQSARLQTFRFDADRTQGWAERETGRMLAQFDANVAAGAFVFGEVDWADVHSLAERLSAAHTRKEGHRTLDVLHVATAVHLKVELFLTLDGGQAALAKAVGLKVPGRLTGGRKK
jgi:predicted nucleic acid-binding protein